MKKALVILLGGVLLFLAAGFLLPRQYHVERSIVIAAEPGEVYDTVADLGTWPEWTIWNQEFDPTMTWEVTGAERGKGSRITWDGERAHVVLSVKRADPAKGILYNLVFDESMHSTGGLRMDVESDGTRVTWFGAGDLGLNPLYRWMGLGADGLLGGSFERGLGALKQRIESAPEDDEPAAETAAD